MHSCKAWRQAAPPRSGPHPTVGRVLQETVLNHNIPREQHLRKAETRGKFLGRQVCGAASGRRGARSQLPGCGRRDTAEGALPPRPGFWGAPTLPGQPRSPPPPAPAASPVRQLPGCTAPCTSGPASWRILPTEGSCGARTQSPTAETPAGRPRVWPGSRGFLECRVWPSNSKKKKKKETERKKKRNESSRAILTNKRVHCWLRRNFSFLIYIRLGRLL